MSGGVTAGSVAAMVVALVSLPLRAPDDALFNSATVVVGTLVAGVVAGTLWHILAKKRSRLLLFTILWATGFVVAALLPVGGETQLDHFLAFVLPLSAIVFTLTGLLTAMLGRTGGSRRRWVAPVAIVLALALGIGLAGQGDEKSRRLELPPRAGVLTPSQPLVEWRSQQAVATLAARPRII